MHLPCHNPDCSAAPFHADHYFAEPSDTTSPAPFLGKGKGGFAPVGAADPCRHSWAGTGYGGGCQEERNNKTRCRQSQCWDILFQSNHRKWRQEQNEQGAVSDMFFLALSQLCSISICQCVLYRYGSSVLPFPSIGSGDVLFWPPVPNSLRSAAPSPQSFAQISARRYRSPLLHGSTELLAAIATDQSRTFFIVLIASLNRLQLTKMPVSEMPNSQCRLSSTPLGACGCTKTTQAPGILNTEM